MNSSSRIQSQRGKEKLALKVLIVDPNPETRSLMKSALRNMEEVSAVGETSTPHNVLEIVNSHPLDIVLIEQGLGEVDPFELVKTIKENPEKKKTNFILMSSELNTESRRKGMEAGIKGYLSKPFDIKSLEAAMRDAMGSVVTNSKGILSRIRQVEFFSNFSDLEVVKLLRTCHTRKYAPEEYIFREGEQGDRLYVIVAGDIEIVKMRDSGPEILATMQPGTVFGEMAIVDSMPRSADARAGRGAMLIELNAEILKDVNDILALKIFHKLAILVTKKLRAYTN